jgi:hypothetical protein
MDSSVLAERVGPAGADSVDRDRADAQAALVPGSLTGRPGRTAALATPR